MTPKDELDLSFIGLNNSVGWIPGVGTAINGLKLGIDALSLAGAVVSLNFAQVVAEVGNIAADVIGLVPIAGAPIASLISQTALGGTEKMGRYVQTGLQSVLDTSDTYAAYQLRVDSVDVPVTLSTSFSGTATVSNLSNASAGVLVDITNTGFEYGWSVPLEGRLALLGLTFSSGN